MTMSFGSTWVGPLGALRDAVHDLCASPKGMRVLLVALVVLGSVVAATRLGAAEPAPLVIEPLQPMPFETWRGVAGRLDFQVVNTSEKKVEIRSIFPRKGKGSGVAKPAVLEPGATGRIELTYEFPEAIGLGTVNFLVKTDDAGLSTLVIRLPYFVQSAYEPDLSVLDFGDVFLDERKKTVLEISSRDVDRLVFTGVVSKPEWLDVSFEEAPSKDPQSVAVVASMNRAPALGISTGEVVLESNVGNDPRLRIPVVMRGFSKYSASPLPLTFGGVLEGESKAAVLELKRRTGAEPVKIERVAIASDALDASIAHCGPGCAQVKFTFESIKAKRGLRGHVEVFFEDDPEPLTVPVDAIVLPNGVGVSDLGDFSAITVKSKTSDLEKR